MDEIPNLPMQFSLHKGAGSQGEGKKKLNKLPEIFKNVYSVVSTVSIFKKSS